jgi:hypothetical protein
MNGITGQRKWAALGAFILMGATPSFVDWEQSPEKHGQIIGFYAVAIGLFWYGFLGKG